MSKDKYGVVLVCVCAVLNGYRLCLLDEELSQLIKSMCGFGSGEVCKYVTR